MRTPESAPRDFMPGECAGASAETFEAIDQGRGQQGPRLLAALAICRDLCPQQRFCEEQKAEITATLGARGVERTVVGGDIVNPSKSQEAHAAHLYEPGFRFDLAHVPPDNRHKLEVIRQGLRVGQLSLRGFQAASHADLAAHLSDRLSASHDVALTEKGVEPASISAFVASAMLRYAIAQRPGDRAFKRNASLSADEILDTEAIQLILSEDVLTLKEAGALNPLEIAKYHKPGLFLAVLEKYKSGFELSPGEVRKVFYESPFRPLAAVAKLVTKKREFRAAKDAGRPISKGEIVPRDVSEGAYIASKLALLKREDASTRALVNRPYMRRYVSDIIRNNSEDPAREIQELHGRIKMLQKEHPDISVIALSHIAYHHSDNPEAAVGMFRNALAEIDHTYGDNRDLSDKLRQRLVFEHMDDAPNVVRIYLERLKQVRNLCTASLIDASDRFKKQYALEFKRPIISDEVSKAYNKFRLIDNRDRKFGSIPTWLREKIVELYDDEDHVRVARNAAIFVRRKYLQTNYVAELTDEGLPYNRIDSKKGAYLAWSEDFTYLKPEEQEVILCVFGLDRLVLGRNADEAALKKHFQSADLLRYVDKHLLPHTVYMSRNSRANDSVLEIIRRAMRDHPHKGNQGNLKAPEQARLDELFEQLMTNLTAEHPGAHNLNDAEVQKRLKLLVRRVMVFAPRVLHDRRSLHLVAKEFLHQADEISAQGISNPYLVASGYSSEFCNEFMTRAKRELPEHPKTTHSEFLEITTTAQAVSHLRRYQNFFNTVSPEFSKRRIPPSYCHRACRRKRNNPEEITQMLQDYDKARKHFANDREVGSDIIRYYCFLKEGDPSKGINAWLTAVSSISPDYMRRIGKSYINRAALTRRGKELTDFLDNGLREFDNYCMYYRENPHPAVDNAIIHYTVFSSGRSDISRSITEYIGRWQDLHDTQDMSDIEPETLRRIVAIHKSDTLRAVKGYRILCRQYLEDPYIQQWMVDKAIRYGVGRAFSSLANMRKLMRASEVRLDEARTFKTRNRAGSISTHEIIADTAPTAHEQLFGSDDQEAKEQKQAQDREVIGRFFEKAQPMEKAAISIAYDIPWLMPLDMNEDEDKVYSFYQVETLDDLKEQVNILLGSRLTIDME